MGNKYRHASTVLRILFSGALTAVLAVQAAMAQALPYVQTLGSIAYISGGIGLDESTAIKVERPKWPLTMLFAVQGRHRQVYAADVRVRILDKSQAEIFAVNEAGPYLLVRLPAGNYTIEATHAGQTQRRVVQIDTSKPQQQGWSWPEKAGETGS